MSTEPLHALLEPAASPPAICAEDCARALTEAGAPGARLLRLAGSALREDLAPAWAAVALADAATDPGADPGGGRRADRARAVLGRLAAEVDAVGGQAPRGSGPGVSCLAVALRLANARGHLPLEALREALAARRTELDVASFATRRELAEHLARRGRVLPLLVLARLTEVTERRTLLLDAGVLASELARGLAVQGRDLDAGRLLLSAEDLARLEVPATALRERPTPAPLRRAFSEQAYWARQNLAKAWALPNDLGWRRAPLAAAWLRGTEERLRLLERVGFDLTGDAVEPTAALLELGWLRGATWWLPPRSVAETR